MLTRPIVSSDFTVRISWKIEDIGFKVGDENEIEKDPDFVDDEYNYDKDEDYSYIKDDDEIILGDDEEPVGPYDSLDLDDSYSDD